MIKFILKKRMEFREIEFRELELRGLNLELNLRRLFWK